MTEALGSKGRDVFSGTCDVLDEGFGFGEINIMYPKINTSLIL
jgi:hypothetical protein